MVDCIVQYVDMKKIDRSYAKTIILLSPCSICKIPLELVSHFRRCPSDLRKYSPSE